MTTSVTSSTSSTSTTSSSNTVSSSSSTSDDLEVQFIDLLVAEIQNQDPTDPLDASEYVSQLSQLSMVQSLDSLNTSQTTTNSELTEMSLLAASNLVGQTVTTPASSVTLDADGSVSGQVTLDSAADSVTVYLYDSSGNVVDQSTTTSAEAGSVAFDFTGLTAGTYTLSATATTSGTTSDLTTYVNETVDKVSLSDDSVQLDVAGVGTVDLSDILGVSNG
nr:flagellar hook capping FlgD N-terminal domain-containing protein [uncultured Tolumonas sp.]